MGAALLVMMVMVVVVCEGCHECCVHGIFAPHDGVTQAAE